MATGDALIDQQHRELVQLLDDLQDAHLGVEEHARRALDALMDFTMTHFTAEEMLMLKVRYPRDAAEAMIADHREFTDYARHRVLEFRFGNVASVLPLRAYLYEWLTNHEFGLDRELVTWIAEHPQGSSEIRDQDQPPAR